MPNKCEGRKVDRGQLTDDRGRAVDRGQLTGGEGGDCESLTDDRWPMTGGQVTVDRADTFSWESLTVGRWPLTEV